MKNKSSFRNLIALTGSAIFGVSSASATTYYWDSNSNSAGFGNTAGTWGTSLFWGTDAAGTGATANTTITSSDIVNFGTATLNYATSNVGVAAGGVEAGGIVFGAGQTTAINLGTAGNAITIGSSGITKNAGSATVTTISPVILGAGQTWTNNSTNLLTLNSTLNLNGNTLTTGGSGTTNFAGAAGAVVSGSGGINVTGGRLWLGSSSAPVHTYSGDTTITGGAVVMVAGNASANSNINLNGGVLESYWTGGLSRTIGTGGNQIRITGGESGFSVNGSTGATFTLGALTWGDTNFNPTKLLLQTQYSQGSSAITLASNINLNGANRTVVASSGVTGAASSTISGNITNGTGTAGLIKEGAGLLNFTGTNTYNGGTTISAGTLAFNSIAAMPNSGAVAVNNATLGVEVGAAGDWTGGTSGVGTLGGLLAGVGGAGTSTVSYTGNVRLQLTMTSNTTYSGDIANVGTTLALTKAGSSSLTLSGNNSHTGGTTLAAGALAIGSANALGSGTVALNGGTIQSNNATARTLTNAITIGGDFTVGGTGNMTFSNTGVTALSATRTIQVANGITAEFAQAFSGTGGLTKGNTIGGILKLTGTSSYTGGTTINDNAGGYNVLEVTVMANGGSNSSIGASTNVAGNLKLKNGTALRYVGSTNASTDRAFTIDSGTAGHGINIESSGAGTLSFTNNAVVLNYGSGGSNKYITFSGTNTGNNTFGKIISGTGMAVNKAGTGKWIFDQVNTYTGATNVNAGVLAVNGTGTINSSAVTINGGDFRYNNNATAYSNTLTFTAGTISGTNWNGGLGGLTIGTSQSISPGNSPGTASTGSQTWAAGGTYVWEINSTAGTAGADPGWDLVNGSGALTITAGIGSEFTIDITSLTALNAAGLLSDFDDTLNYNWLIADFLSITGFDETDFILDDSPFANTYAGQFGIALGNTGSIGGDASQIYLTYTAIPEPGVALLGGLSLLGLVLRRRR